MAAQMKISRELTMMEEILSYQLESLETVEIPPEPPEQAGRTLYERLQLHAYRSQILNRTKDMKKNLGGARHELALLSSMMEFTKQHQAHQMARTLNDNSLTMLTLQQTHVKNQWYLKLMMYFLAAMLSFQLCQSFMGEFTIANTLWARDFVESLVRSYFNIWFFIQIIVWISVSAIIVRFADRFLHRSKGEVTYKIEMNKRVLWKNFNVFLARKEQARKRGCKWLGFPVAGGFNSEHREANLNKNLVFNAKELHQRLVSVLKDNDVWMSDDMENYRKLINDEPHAFYNNGGPITRAKVLTAIKGTMQSKKKQTFEVDTEETAVTGINDKKDV